MTERKNNKDVWDKIASLTPLLLGIAVTGVGAFFTHIYNFRQLQLNQIAALDKFRPLLISEKPDEREFGYAAFAALGYEQVAARIIQLKLDESGRTVLVQLAKSGSQDVRATAENAIKTLNQVHPLVRQFEFGDMSDKAVGEMMRTEDTRWPAEISAAETWVEQAAKEVKISSKLGREILYDVCLRDGTRPAQKFQALASKVVSTPLESQEKEKVWLNEFLTQRDKYEQERFGETGIPRNSKKRSDRFRKLMDEGDWELKTVGSSTTNR